MLEGIDPVQLTTTIIAVLGIIGTTITGLKARRYLAVTVAFMNILSAYYRAKADGIVTDAEKLELADEVLKLGKSVDEAKNIPAGFTAAP